MITQASGGIWGRPDAFSCPHSDIIQPGVPYAVVLECGGDTCGGEVQDLSRAVGVFEGRQAAGGLAGSGRSEGQGYEVAVRVDGRQPLADVEGGYCPNDMGLVRIVFDSYFGYFQGKVG